MSSVAPSPTPAGNTGPQSKVIAWTSFVVDTRTSKVYSVGLGGHNDYAGNEVDELDLERAQPVWTQRLAPTPNAQLTNCQSYYADGRPTARHTWYGVTLDVANDRIMLFGGDGWCINGGFGPATDSYNIGSNSYSPSGTHPGLPGDRKVMGASLDPTTGDVYIFGNFQLRRWNRAANSFSTLSPSGSAPWGSGAMSAMDTTRGRILIVAGSNDDHHTYTLGTNAFATITLTGAEAANISSGSGQAMIYVSALDRYLVRQSGAGGTVYQIHPTSWEVTQFATTGGASVPATQNGPYNKFLYVPRLQGAVYVPSYSGNAWFLRIH